MVSPWCKWRNKARKQSLSKGSVLTGSPWCPNPATTKQYVRILFLFLFLSIYETWFCSVSRAGLRLQRGRLHPARECENQGQLQEVWGHFPLCQHEIVFVFVFLLSLLRPSMRRTNNSKHKLSRYLSLIVSSYMLECCSWAPVMPTGWTNMAAGMTSTRTTRPSSSRISKKSTTSKNAKAFSSGTNSCAWSSRARNRLSSYSSSSRVPRASPIKPAHALVVAQYPARHPSPPRATHHQMYFCILISILISTQKYTN